MDDIKGLTERRAHTMAILGRPGTMTSICEHIAEGGALTALARTWGVSYSVLLRFTKASDEHIKMYTQAQADRKEWYVERVKQELSTLGFLDIRGLFANDGTLLPVDSWPDSIAASIAGIEITETFEGNGADRVWTGYTKKIKIHDKLKAIEMLARSMAMFTDNVKHDVGATLEELLTRSRELEDKPHED